MARGDAPPSFPRIRSALIQLLKQCNFRCRHCSQSAPFVGDQHADPVPLEGVRARIRELRKCGVERVRFTGGEPLLHPHIGEILHYALRLGISTSIVTNGTLLGGRGDALRAAGLEAIWISLYGSTEAGYRAIANIAPNVSRLAVAIREFTDVGVRVGLYCAVDLTVDVFETSLVERLVPSGVTHVKFLQLMEQGRGAALTPSSPALSEASLHKLVALKRSHPNTQVSVSMRSNQASTFRALGFSLPSDLGCTAGSPDGWSMGVEGSLTPCCLMMSPGKQTVQNSPRRLLPILGSEPPLSRNEEFVACPALPSYPRSTPSEFVCPLAYASL